MSWVDGILLAFIVVFLAMGARLGSLWVGGAFLGGFFGGFVADTYALTTAGHMGMFPGSTMIAAVVLFLLGTALVFGPAWFLSQFFADIFMPAVDSVAGFVLGGALGLLALSLVLSSVPPARRALESSSTWQDSRIARPLHAKIEGAMQRSQGHRLTSQAWLPVKAQEVVAPIKQEARKKLRGLTTGIAEKLQE